jgi:hypothetical protein
MMRIEELQEKLFNNHQAFIKAFIRIREDEFASGPPDKWTTGQHLDHIVRSVAPVNLAFAFPAFLLRLLFGKNNRAPRTYDELVLKYQNKLGAGGRASGRFIPSTVAFTDRDKLVEKLEKLINSLNQRIPAKSEEQLDTLLLPHPLMGKLTLREMLYFTLYHVEHHHKQIKAFTERQPV